MSWIRLNLLTVLLLRYKIIRGLIKTLLENSVLSFQRLFVYWAKVFKGPHTLPQQPLSLCYLLMWPKPSTHYISHDMKKRENIEQCIRYLESKEKPYLLFWKVSKFATKIAFSEFASGQKFPNLGTQKWHFQYPNENFETPFISRHPQKWWILP